MSKYIKVTFNFANFLSTSYPISVPITLRNETTAEKEEEEEKAHILESVETEELEDIEDDDEEEEIELTTEKVVEEVKTVVVSEADKSTLAPTPSPTEPIVEVAEVATTREISDEWNTIEDIDDVTPTMSIEDCKCESSFVNFHTNSKLIIWGFSNSICGPSYNTSF